MLTFSGLIRCLTALINGGDMASPIRRRPWTNSTGPENPASNTPSSRRPFSDRSLRTESRASSHTHDTSQEKS